MGILGKYWGNIELMEFGEKILEFNCIGLGKTKLFFFLYLQGIKEREMKMKLKNVQKQRKERNSFILFSILFLYNKQIVNNVDKIFFLGFFIKFFFELYSLHREQVVLD